MNNLKFARHRGGEYSFDDSIAGVRVRASISRVLYDRWAYSVFVYPNPRLPGLKVIRTGYVRTMAAAMRAASRETRELLRIVDVRRKAA